jgi:hypothetical protein
MIRAYRETTDNKAELQTLSMPAKPASDKKRQDE